MATGQAIRLSRDEYLEFERQAATRHEFVDGEVREMVGASLPHNQIACNVAYLVQSQTKGRPFVVCQSDMRVRIPSGPYYYPDVVVAPFPPRLEDDEADTLLNPLVLVEVLSPSTMATDRGEKLDNYRCIPSLSEYLIVAQDRVEVDRHFRRDDGWQLEVFMSLADIVPLPILGCELPLAEVYDRVFPVQ